MERRLAAGIRGVQVIPELDGQLDGRQRSILGDEAYLLHSSNAGRQHQRGRIVLRLQHGIGAGGHEQMHHGNVGAHRTQQQGRCF